MRCGHRLTPDHAGDSRGKRPNQRRPIGRVGTLAMMVSGAPDVVAAITRWLNKIGRKVYVPGTEVGQTQVVKLINTLVMAANLVMTPEGLVTAANSASTQ